MAEQNNDHSKKKQELQEAFDQFASSGTTKPTPEKVVGKMSKKAPLNLTEEEMEMMQEMFSSRTDAILKKQEMDAAARAIREQNNQE